MQLYKSADNIMAEKKKRFIWMFHFLIMLPHNVNAHYKLHTKNLSVDLTYPIFNPATIIPTFYKETET